MRRFLFRLCWLLPLLCLSCSGKNGRAPLEDAGPALAGEEVNISDPGGPIPAPRLPAHLAQNAPAPAMAQNAPAPAMPDQRQDKTGGQTGGLYAYRLECLIQSGIPGRQTPASGAPGAPQARPADADEEKAGQDLLAAFAANSSLYRLLDTPPQNLAGLERRLALSLDEGRDLLRSRGWYAGRVRGTIFAPGQMAPDPDMAAPDMDGERGPKKTRPPASDRDGQQAAAQDKALVRVTFIPGRRFVMGSSRVLADLPAMDGEDAQRAAKNLPRSLADAGLPPGAPAVAADVLTAVEAVRELFLDNGFPFAEITGTRFVADHDQACLEAEVRVRPGPLVRMGDIELKGDISVRPAYVEAMRQWRRGRPWSQRRIESLRESLRQSGLFQRIEIEAAPEDKNGLRPVLVSLGPAPERTVSGALKYHTDFGPGLQGAWEHRNLTGKGDSLRFAAPLWLDMQEVTAAYRLPFFLRRDQDFIANAGFLNQDTDAYRLTSAAASAGLQRRLARFLSATVQGAAQGGAIKEPDEPDRDYFMYGLPLTLTYDSTRSLLDASRGQRLIAAAAPYAGQYNSAFSVLRARLEGRTFLPLTEGETLVLALKGVVGALGGDHADNLPPSVRFYSGGGGSVRGYEFQSIGPRNADDKPLGGGSLLEASAEARWKITPEWGLVAFVDGGSAYEDLFDDPGQVLRWGAGLGLRYYTVVGPVRLDVATPLNPRADDDPLQLYISIGQSF